MKLLLLLLIPFMASAQKTYYAAPTGNDANSGAIDKPFKTMQKLGSVLKSGDTGYLRGGSYTSTLPATDWQCLIQNLAGKEDSHIVISNYPGEFPIFDYNGFFQTNNTTALRINNCTYLDIYGIRIVNLLQNNANIVAGIEAHDCTHIKFERVSVDNIGGAAVRQTTGCNDWLYVNCDASRCGDPKSTGGGNYGNADGFDCNAGTATYINCRAWWCSDDGFDCYGNDSHIYYRGCWSFKNGYIPGTYTNPGSQADGMGFKWGNTATDQSGSVLRTYTNCISFNNKGWGFDQNVARCKSEFYNNTSFKNVAGGWATGYSINPREASILKNNVSFIDPVTVSDVSGLVLSNNSWQVAAATAASFASTDTAGVAGPRFPDGSLPFLPFLRLSVASNLIDKGVDVGLPFTPPAPDLGAYEVAVVPPPPVFTNVTQSKAFTKNNCTSGTGTSVVYIVAAGKYSASTQAAADQLATTDINNNGQNWANLNGTCIPKTIIRVEIYYSDGTKVVQQ